MSPNRPRSWGKTTGIPTQKQTVADQVWMLNVKEMKEMTR